MTSAVAVNPEAKAPANLLTLDRTIRQQIYHQSFAPAYEKDLRFNKESFLYEVLQPARKSSDASVRGVGL